MLNLDRDQIRLCDNDIYLQRDQTFAMQQQTSDSYLCLLQQHFPEFIPIYLNTAMMTYEIVLQKKLWKFFFYQKKN